MQYSFILSTAMATYSLFSVSSARDPFKVSMPSVLYRVDVAPPREVGNDGIRGKDMVFTSNLMAARTAASKIHSSSKPRLGAYVYYIKTAGVEDLFAYTGDGGSSEIKEFRTSEGIPLAHIVKGEAIARDGQVIKTWDFTMPNRCKTT
ncbi:hypothetical protein MCOR02_006317 [Pyricularia oryzae]|nr:hypothetical protein MCOR02_006317 [Pyricularia oryzae]KAI6260347.1 hypothetical protein MCOR19_003364 [Pyricularia oryzae]KAI6334788.1 hypothetical protein MCOR29_000538 [Pyricularia oryzae]KAI6343171.1 hypothetical protein MCOR30_001612 [Pyricularia oryzae]KAI6376403.1 hypothetical protein MCOR31_001671 [Pyricularia oryzae]